MCGAGLRMADHLAMSFFTTAASACGSVLTDPNVAAESSRRLRTASSSSAMTSAALSLAMIGYGVCLGANMALRPRPRIAAIPPPLWWDVRQRRGARRRGDRVNQIESPPAGTT